nr:hypothetical protein [Tanacetum cinerariifolium]
SNGCPVLICYKARVSRASLPLTVISHRRCRLICYSGKSRGLSNPCSSYVLYDGGCTSLGNRGMGAVGIDRSGIDEVEGCDDVSSGEGVEGKAFPTDSGFEADQDRANISKSFTLPNDLAPRVTSPATDEGSMQLKLDELMDLCTSLQRQHSEMVAKFEAQELEINRLKARVKLLEDREGVTTKRFRDDTPIKGRNLDEGEVAAERVSDDTEEMATLLTVLASGVAKVPTSSGSIPTVGPPAAEVPTGNDVVPTACPIFATATVVTPYTKRKGKETMVESETPKKKKIQKQIDIQMARQLEEEMERDAQRMNEQIARDAEIARIHAEEEIQIMIDGLDRSNETVAKYLQEYHQFATELPLERRIELISDLVRYQDNYAKGKEVMVESKTPKKQQVQEQIDAQVSRELEEQLEKEDQRRAEQIARDAEIARIHAEEEIHSMIDGLDSNNETVAKYLEEYRQFSSE